MQVRSVNAVNLLRRAVAMTFAALVWLYPSTTVADPSNRAPRRHGADLRSPGGDSRRYNCAPAHPTTMDLEAPAYQIHLWVLRPVAKSDPTESEFRNHLADWQFFRVPPGLTERELNSGNLTALARANPHFEVGKVIESVSAPIRGGEPWDHQFGKASRIVLTVLDPPPPPLAGSKPGDIACAVKASFTTEAGAARADYITRWNLKGRFEIPSNRISVFNAGQRYVGMPASGKPPIVRIHHDPRDLFLFAIHAKEITKK